MLLRLSAINMFKARKNEIIDETGKQIAVVIPSNCTRHEAEMMAAYAAQQMNNEFLTRKRGGERRVKGGGRP